MTTTCVILMGATTSPLVGQVTDTWLARVAAACNTQQIRDVSPEYGNSIGVRVGAGTQDVQPGEMVFSIVDSLPDAPGAIAYHDTAGNDVPVAFLALSTCSSLDDVSVAISHEVCETAGDASCDLWVDDGNGSEWARELCDAVESNSYPIDLKDEFPAIAVSDFVLPGFFGPHDVGPYSYMQRTPSPAVNTVGFPPGPFQTAHGGYQIRRDNGSNITQVQGNMRPAKFLSALRGLSRTARRGVEVKTG